MGELSAGRLRLTFLTILVFYMALVYRLYSLQVTQGKELSEEARKQRTHLFIKKGRRGLILDAEGNPLTENVPTFSIFAVPNEIENNEEIARQLSFILDMPDEDIREKISHKEKSFRWIKRHISKKIAERIRLEELPGIGIADETKRSYPKGDFLSPLLGFTNKDLVGLWGLELSQEKKLAGREGHVKVEAMPTGMALTDKTIENKPPHKGASLQLTIDPSIQYHAETLAKEATLTFQATRTIISAISIPAFKIIAMAQYPTFDPNHYASFPKENWRNLNVSWTYEPGSTMKVFTIASGLASHRILPSTTYFDPGYLRVGKYTIRDAHNERHGVVTPNKILTYSCNIGAARVALQVGQNILSRYFTAFGFGEKIGLGLPGEEKGIFQKEKHWAKIRLANIAFGQGISVTPVQLLQAYAILANGGRKRKPILIDRVILPNGKTETASSADQEQIIPKSVAEEILKYMENVVKKGTGKNAQITGYRIAGKTGTAQKAVRGRYHPDKFIGSFVGTFPLPHPRWVVLVIVDEPRGVPYGSRVAAPYFSRLAREILRSYGVPPQVDTQNNGRKLLTLRPTASEEKE